MASSKQIPTTAGASVEGDLTVHGNMSIHVNAQPSTSQLPAREKASFRSKLPMPTPHYKGRTNILENILYHFTGAFNESTNCWQRMAAIVGMGGMGKSETASKFANKYREVFPCAAWINAETKESTLDSFLSLAKLLEIVPEKTKQADLELVKKVYRHIDEQYFDRVLFIFDNAHQLHSDGTDFGIFDYLPTEDLANQHFPFVIITSQMNWQKDIKAFKLEELSHEESIDFFRSSFQVSSSECDECFNKLFIQLQGYPLAMNLATSNIDFDSQTNPLSWLQAQIQIFMKNFEKEDSRILTEKINQNLTSRYNKTLSTVWQLSFDRLQAEFDGANAHMLLQALSFFHTPVKLFDLHCVFVECPFCPGTPDWIKYDCVKDSIRLLQRLHFVDYVIYEPESSRKEKVFESSPKNNLNDFLWEFRVHRLVQLVVRLQVDCGPVLEDILRYLACWKGHVINVCELNVPAVEETLRRTTLTKRGVTFVQLLALRNNPIAKSVVCTTSPPAQDPSANIWLAHPLTIQSQTLNSEAIEVLRRLVKISTSEKTLVDKRSFTKLALNMLHYGKLFSNFVDDRTKDPRIFLQSFAGIEDIACELIVTGCSFTDVYHQQCTNVARENTAVQTLIVGRQLLGHLIDAQRPDCIVVEFTRMLEQYREFADRGNSKWEQYMEERYQFHSSDFWKKFDCDMKSAGSDQVALQQVFFSNLLQIFSVTVNTNYDGHTSPDLAFRDMDSFVYDVLYYERDMEVLLELMQAFNDVVALAYKHFLDVWQSDKDASYNEALIWICSTWMTFSLQEAILSSDTLCRHLARATVLAEITKLSAEGICNSIESFGFWYHLRTFKEQLYEKFVTNYSESANGEIKILVTISREIQRKLLVVRKNSALPCRETCCELDNAGSKYFSVECDGCNEVPFEGRSFRCSTCLDYDLCHPCYAERKIHFEHAHLFLFISSLDAAYALRKNIMRRRVSFDVLGTRSVFLRECISSKVTCAECSEAITGLRFMCTECEDYDMCEKCHMERNVHSHHLLASTQSPDVDILGWVTAMFQAMRLSRTIRIMKQTDESSTSHSVTTLQEIKQESSLIGNNVSLPHAEGKPNVPQISRGRDPFLEAPPEFDQSGSCHLEIICKGCFEPNIKGRRLKCCTCHDYDLCYSCYAEKKIHVENAHVFMVFSAPNSTRTLSKVSDAWGGSPDNLGSSSCVIVGEAKLSKITCKNCIEVVTGVRFMCIECDDYDLCQECHIDRNVHRHHFLLSAQSPIVDILRQKKAMLQDWSLARAMRNLHLNDDWPTSD